MSDKLTLGRVEKITFPEHAIGEVYARVDTGARKSAIWASYAEVKNDKLQVIFFGKGDPLYTGKKVEFQDYDRIAISTSTGQVDKRYAVKMQVKIVDKKLRATFTLADRSTQVYPVLLGRNVLYGKFIVDVEQGTPLAKKEKKRINHLQRTLYNGDDL